MRPLSVRLGEWFPALIALALPTVFMPSLVDAFVLPRASVVIAGACLGTGLALLIPGKPQLGILRWPLVAAAAAAILAFAFSVSWPLSLVGSYTRYESLPVRLSYLGLLAVPVWLLRSERARWAVAAGLVFGAAASSIEAVIQWWQHVPFRPDGNLGNASLLGALIAMAFPLAVYKMFKRDWSTPLWWLAAAAMLAGLWVSTSRGGALAALAGCLALGVFAVRDRIAVVAATIVASTVVGAALVAILLVPALRQLNGDPGPTRLHLYPDALRMVFARPLTGWGEDATGLVFGRFLTGDWSPGVTFDRAHSGLLDLGATQGLLGLVALGVVLVVLMRGVWKGRSSQVADPGQRARWGVSNVGAMGAALVAYSVWVVFNFDWAPATGVFWLLAGTAWSAVRSAEAPMKTREADAAAVQLRPSAYPGRAAGAVGLGLLAVGLAALPVLAEAWYSQGRPDLAVRVDPLQSQYHRALGEELIAEGSRTEGIQELRLAARLGETDPSLYVELGDEE
ncbi:MAG TPA: O-antigen ligase family protein, partial [Isosphaeraceae bacterium]|nr:O-antigen ligase family protein [Isosphaeraceae bacterium]